ncbi:hypothetical protein JCM17843_22680 [Kordiimonadales bacterium JCM 17843]|nr:hypothetical protein JCM17843_22680 [Kordiimonadales bacterium JCM 17843]
MAQVTTGTIRGHVAGVGAGTVVEAVNPDTGFSRKVKTREDGSYALTGLRPGTYRITATGPDGVYEEVVRIQVAQSLVVDMDQLTSDIEEIVVVGKVRPGMELRTSEIGTNVTTEQIDMLPQGSRNFLNFARLAPGVRVSRDEFRQQFSGGAANAQGDSLAAGQTNVFIDGVSLKSNVQQGGIAGQDGSRGNPFSQLAVQEFKVLTQNFKAEFEQASSSVITAVTKSGSNEFEAEAFGLFARKNFTERNFFDKRDDRPKPDFSRNQFGASVSGPIIKDKLFFFLSYEGNFQDRSETVVPGVVTPEQQALLGFDPQEFAGTRTSPFREHLGFAKLTWDISQSQYAEVAVNVSRESDIRDFGGQNSLERANNIKNPVTSVRAKHEFSGDFFLNELTFDWRKSTFNPTPLNQEDPALNFRNVINLGGQSFRQEVQDVAFTLRDNVTFSDISWHGNHVVKAGIRVARVEADVEFGAFINPQFDFFDQPADDLDFSFPAEARLGVGDPNISVGNTQFGVFLQDDWEATDKLIFNIGIRWDYEGNMNNKNFVTPDDVAETMRLLQEMRDADTADALAQGFSVAPDAFDFRADDFISTGNNRSPFMKRFSAIGGVL